MLVTVRTSAEVDALSTQVSAAASATAKWLRESNVDPLTLLYRAKFDPVGFDPADPGRPLNLVEQINQTWSLIAALEATRLLLQRHPESGGFHLAPGAHAAQALDIVSVVPNRVGAEIFAAVSPRNNNKLARDLDKLVGRHEANRYAIFLSPLYLLTERLPKLERDGVEVWSVALLAQGSAGP